jgi:hypothetical protein
MRYFFFKSKNECTYKTSFFQDEYQTVEDAREDIAKSGDTSLEEWCGLKWDEEEQEWERELTHEEALTAALALDAFGDFKVREVTVEWAFDRVLESYAVATLPETLTPSEDDFESEEAYLQELDYIDGDIDSVNAEIRSVLSYLPFLTECQKELFDLMVWQHVNFKKKYRLQYPTLHPEDLEQDEE